jgi:hypothetical protein
MFALQSCFKEDELITFHPRGGVRTDTIPMTEYYTYQIYYSLDSGTIVKQNLKNECDLGFECSANGWRILLNTSNFMTVSDLGLVPFGGSYDTLGKKMLFDKSDGNPDSTAFGMWFNIIAGDTISKGHVYALNRGVDESGNPLGLVQVILDSLKLGTYYFRTAPLKGGAFISGTVSKDSRYYYNWYSIPAATTKSLEPPKDSYDLLFTQYTTMLITDEGEPYPYLVTGTLINRQGVAVSRDTIHLFDSITRVLIPANGFSTALDAIGYDWKYYNFETGLYSVLPKLSYFIRSKTGIWYKFRFIGFYDRNYSKGYPVIQYLPL